MGKISAISDGVDKNAKNQANSQREKTRFETDLDNYLAVNIDVHNDVEINDKNPASAQNENGSQRLIQRT